MRTVRPAPSSRQVHVSIRCQSTPSSVPDNSTKPGWRQEIKEDLKEAKDSIKSAAHKVTDKVEHKKDQLNAKKEELLEKHPLSQAEADAEAQAEAEEAKRHPKGHTGQIGVEYALRGQREKEEKERVRKLQEAVASGKPVPPEVSSITEGVSAPPPGSPNLSPAEIATFIKEG